MGEAAIEARKRDLRRRLKRARSLLAPDLRAAIDAEVARRVQDLPAWQDADLVFSYLSVGDEVGTRALIRAAWEQGKTVAIPRVAGERSLDWYRTEDLSHVELSCFHIEEPPAEPDFLLSTDESFLARHRPIALVPALAFDEVGFRLGYGGGFYDAFLAGFPGTSIGLARQAQVLPSLADQGACDDHDLPVDVLVSEERVIRPAVTYRDMGV